MGGRTRIVWVLLALALISSGVARGADAVGEGLGRGMIWTGQAEGKREGYFVGFRKRFELGAVPARAILHLFADTRYVLWVNGAYVERGPGRFEPAAPEYDSVDVGRYLRTGENVVAVLVAARVSNGKMRMHEPGLTAELVGDGQEVFVTDGSWKWSEEIPYREAKTDWPNLYDVVDARVGVGDWTAEGFDDGKWGAAVPLDGKSWGNLTARRMPLLRETVVTPAWQAGKEWPMTLKEGEKVSFRFGRLVLAYVRLEMEADAGSELELSWSPKTRYICKSGEQTYLATDTHSIFAGAIGVKSGRVTLKRVTFVERLYPFDRVGSFHSNDELLNKLWATCVRGMEVTSEDAYIDCADRERVEWMDCDPPAFDVTRVAEAGPTVDGKRAWADPRLLEEMLRRTALTLQPEGWVKAHTSSDRFDIHAKMEDRACDWVEGVRRYCESSGKTEVIREIWPAVVAQMNYFLDRRTERGLVLAREWVVWGNPVGYRTCEGTALNAFVYKALVDAAYLGNVIGEKEQAEKFEAAARALGAAINSVLWDEGAGTYFGGYDSNPAASGRGRNPSKLKVVDHLIEPTRHAALFALDQGVVPDDRRARVTAYLMVHAPTDNPIMQYYYFFKQQYALDDAAADVSVLNTERRQWKDMANSPYGAGFEELHATGGSQAHCYGIFPAYFLSAYVLGARMEGTAQGKQVVIEPRLGDLTEASGAVVTELGAVKVLWKKTGERWTFAVEVPEGITARLRLPVGKEDAATVDGGVVFGGRVGSRWVEVGIGSGKHEGSWGLVAPGAR